MMSNEMQTERKEKARRLRSSGLTYRQIAKEVGASLETLHRWCKDIPPQTDKQTLEPSGETPNRMFGEPFTVPKQTNGRVQTHTSESRSTAFGVWLLLFFLVLVVLIVLLSLFRDRITGGGEKAREEESELESVGYGGRSIEDL